MKRYGAVWWCAVFAMVLMGNVAFAQAGDRCAQYAACGPCAADAGCGWCAGNGRCMSGSEQGSPYCPGGWAWTDNQCGGGFNGNDACWRHHECNSCAGDPSCGWCGSTGRCLSGSEQGTPYCPAGWAWTANQCGGYTPSYTSDVCSHFTSCGQCAADAQCGWCGASGQCMTGGQQGAPACGGGWAWTANQCGGYAPMTVGDPCSRFNNCGQCAADAQCGWCAGTGRCMSGTQQGSPYCPAGWAWSDNQCGGVARAVPADSCSRFRDCGSCAADARCGWCGATNHCIGGGTAQGSPYCPGAWAWTDNQCTYGYAVPVAPNAPANPCAGYRDCNSCAAQAQCGWCGATGQCTVGDANGGGYCPGGWAWTSNQCTY